MSEHIPNPCRDTAAAAAFLSLSPKTLEVYRCRGGGPPFARLGRRVVYRERDLELWVSARMRTNTAA
ncbi:MAG: helix-turn-helix domain-containing protein [Rhodospirillaceae bacterium]